MKFTRTAVALSAAAMLVLGACTTPAAPSTPTETAPTDSPNTEAPAALTITMLPKNLGNPYFDQSTAGAQEAAAEIGATVTEVGPATGSADGQVSYVETATQQNVSAIIFSANDPDAMCDSLNAAVAAGIKVVTFDSDTGGCPEARQAFVNQVSVDGVAQTLVEMIADQTGGSGEVAWLSATAQASNQNAWIEATNAKLASDHPDIKIVDTVYGDDDDQKSFDQTKALLAKYPDLKLIVAPTTVGIVAAARYISTSDRNGQVLVTGLGTPTSMKPYLESGTSTEFALWNPQDLGYLATFAAQALVNGDITGAEGDKFSAGRLGDYTVGAGGEIPLGPAFKFNASNIDQFNW
ncbi:MAG: rhamnose ABC transporter substrate-binding protein [Propionibacteriaceae bacterium]|nr:rhamnose ABC transporter substrate-binding protein [Propionibacteriaceae bacterium]